MRKHRDCIREHRDLSLHRGALATRHEWIHRSPLPVLLMELGKTYVLVAPMGQG